MADIDLLRKISIFKQLPDETLATIAESLEVQRLAAGEILFHQGDPGDVLICVKQGRIAIYVPIEGWASSGQIIRIFRPGECMGEMSLIDGKPRSATARAEVATVILKLSRAAFQKLLVNHHPEMSLTIMRVLCDRVRYTTDFLREVHHLVDQILQGNYQVTQFETEYQDDTLTALASQFVQMTTRLQQRKEKFRQVTEMCIEIDDARVQKELQNIFTSDYFQTLMTYVEDIRKLENL